MSVGHSHTPDGSHAMMTRAELDAIEERERHATKGPWQWDVHEDTLVAPKAMRAAREDSPCGPSLDGHEGEDDMRCGCTPIIETDSGYYPPRAHDRVFIAHARADIPALTKEVRRLRAVIERMCGLEPGTYGVELEPQ